MTAGSTGEGLRSPVLSENTGGPKLPPVAPGELFMLPSFWILLSPSAESLEFGALGRVERTSLGQPLDWTDSRHSLFEVLGNTHF